MIVDTSALIAILFGEQHHEALLAAIVAETASVPAPVLTEFSLVAAGRGEEANARDMVADLIEDGLIVADFTEVHAGMTWDARNHYGKGNGNGGKLNLLDLMVYAVAKEHGEPLLCTGKDFATTDLVLHPASRPW